MSNEALAPDEVLAGSSLNVDEPNPRANDNGTVVIDRPDGQLTFARTGDPEPGPFKFHDYLNAIGGITSWGDLNRDGHPDYLVRAEEGTYVISGALASGTHDPRVVGVRLLPDPTSPSANLESIRPVGDQNGDGADDVALENGHLVSGRALLSKQPGSTIQVPRPFHTVPQLVTALRLDPDAPPALVEVFGGVSLNRYGSDDPIEVKLGGASPICLVTTNREVDPSIGGPYVSAGGSNGVGGHLVDGHRIIEFGYSTRNTLVLYRWDLDA